MPRLSKLERLRRLCLALPEATEKLTWGSDVTFRVRDRMFAVTGLEGESVCVKADPDEHEAMLATGWEVAPYVGRYGWVVRSLAARTDWDEVAEAIASSYRLIAPRRLARMLDE